MKPALRSLAVFAVLAVAGHAQNNDAPGRLGQLDLDHAPLLDIERAAIDDAKDLARSSDLGRAEPLAAVEDLLTALNESKPNTAEWRMETAQRFVHLAEQLAREGRPENVARLVHRALQHLQVADNPSQNAATRASAKALAGFIQERYLADDTAARSSYQAAAALDPGNKQAKEQADRLQRKDDNEKARTPRG